MPGEDLVGLDTIQRLHPRPITLRAIQYWCTRGVRGIVLWNRLIGGERFTSLTAYRRFVEELNGDVDD